MTRRTEAVLPRERPPLVLRRPPEALETREVRALRLDLEERAGLDERIAACLALPPEARLDERACASKTHPDRSKTVMMTAAKCLVDLLNATRARVCFGADDRKARL